MIVKKDGNIILDQKGINQALKRIAQEIISKHESLTNIAFIGIRTRGAFLSYRLRNEISKKAKDKLPTDVLDINL
jgi:pyrimidine operon attenuation protein / uracil phosphoribosyltransferase